ncbi:MAG: DNA polymerase III subunit delta' [Nitrospinae bacterium]|nr:DNA polymerase III subunit delta' [Nitrospinota bacterium]
MSFERILGQNTAIQIITKALQNSSVAHAYLFYGLESVGKKLTAIEFAKALNCKEAETGSNCGDCPSCRKIDKGIHPDFFLIEPSQTTSSAREGIIKVEEIRELQRKLAYLPYEGKNKVAIIDGAETMNPQAASCFLKTLEEPPASTVLILIASNPFRLLQTLVSRCQGIRFNPLPASVVRQIIKPKMEEGEIDPQELELRVMRSQGQVSRALEEDVPAMTQNRKDLIQLLEKVSFNEMALIFNWSKSCAGDAGQIPGLLDELAGILRDVAFLKSGYNAKDILNPDLAQPLRALANRKTIASLLKMHDSVHETKLALQGNANKQLALENMLLNFCEAA